jgi:hypothetical protein
MDEDNITQEGNAGASQLNAAAPEGAVGTVTKDQADSLSLAEINKLTGKNFPSRESALKSITDTFSYVGKKRDDVAREVKAEISASDVTDKLARELEEMRKERFFDRNPKYAEPSVRKLLERIGGNPEQVVDSPEFKTLFEKVSGYDESQKLKTVLGSNPRIAASRDSLAKAREISASGQAGTSDEVNALVANAIKDAYGMR